MQTLRYFLFLCSCFIFTLQLTAQERYLTQFYAAPLIMDPSLTGNFDGNYRISMAYRDQWFRNLENPFSTFALSVDLSFDLNKRKR
ncbi:MAG TPA: type IX secretion system membrane protein PorP/SprF, partial [Saprospiraceae bacterium]|nr:type IX secretion system membrane protein PorP/SprF [Saprospiraceae bacterium]